MTTAPEDIAEVKRALAETAECTIRGLACATVTKRTLKRMLADIGAYAELEAEMGKQVISCAAGAGKRCTYVHAADRLARFCREAEEIFAGQRPGSTRDLVYELLGRDPV